MPTSVYAVGNTEADPTVIEADARRTVLIVQNLDTVAGTDYLYMSDERGQVATTGLQIAPVGGSLSLRKCQGEEPEKTWYLVAATAACPVRVMELYGVPTKAPEEPEEPDPQEPEKPIDAPRMSRRRPITATGYL